MPNASLSTDIKYLKGVGPIKAKFLAQLEIKTIKDLLYHYPYRWSDRSNSNESLPEYLQKDFIFIGEVISASQAYVSAPVSLFKVILRNQREQAEALFFRKRKGRFDPLIPLKKDFIPGKKFVLIGEKEPDFLKIKIKVSEYYPYTISGSSIHFDRIIPVYRSCAGISQKFLREISYSALRDFAEMEKDFIPSEILIKRGFLSLSESLKNLHFPSSALELKKARERAVYEEFFLMLCAWGLKKAQNSLYKKPRKYEIKKHLLTPFKEKLGFEFTLGQKKAINEIFKDMTSPHPMSRLIQGDVGCGKTVVALSAALLACENAHQTAFMAPTEILARQHYETFLSLLSGLPVRIALLTSSIKSSEKEILKEKVRRGEIDILVGTHSLIEKEINFKSLGLAIIDEQHKFGVRQRAALRQKGFDADMLIMTATPIPRTLALSLYGDLDISQIKDMPPGRKPVKTFTASKEEAEKKLLEEIKKGGQVYTVFPAIEETLSEIKSVKKEFEKFSSAYPDIKSGIIYGTMRPADKEKAMKDFAQGKTKVLFATQVVEVGLDIKNASLMIIQNAERFGLAALHQLRGRVGRGQRESFCLAVSETVSDKSQERLKAFCKFSDGFSLSEEDAKLRGHGEILGVKQHGDLEFIIADPYYDREILLKAAEDKEELFYRDPNLSSYENAALKKKILEIYSEKLKLIDAG
ncbi:MAG: ATP-dependent DNA helicase RecG [Elusimicrobiota bacterium]